MIPVIKPVIINAVIDVEKTCCGIRRNRDIRSPQGKLNSIFWKALDLMWILKKINTDWINWGNALKRGWKVWAKVDHSGFKTVLVQCHQSADG